MILGYDPGRFRVRCSHGVVHVSHLFLFYFLFYFLFVLFLFRKQMGENRRGPEMAGYLT
jgi:hypothetical protein